MDWTKRWSVRPGSVLADLRSLRAEVEAGRVPMRRIDDADRVDGWNALLASWLPGTQGGGVADVLSGKYNPTGKPPVTWMRSFEQQPINSSDGRYPLYPREYGLSYSR